MSNERFNTWCGPGWYAPRSEYQNYRYCGNWDTVYHHVGDDPDEMPDTHGMALGTPSWFETEDELEGE